jgi:hypothetical protein
MRPFAAHLLAGSLLLALAGAARADDTAARPARDWTIVYYMSYDNNLEACGRPILDMLGKGVTSANVVVTCQADFTAPDGMKRYVETKDGETVAAVEGEGSAEEETVRDYLEWARTTYPARHFALVFLDHGGRLNQMSYDEHPAEGGHDWLDVVDTAQVITTWRDAVRRQGGEVELLFLQQCGKGTLENYHALRGAARVILGSQTSIGAPNSYYPEAIRWACEHPDGSGEELAAQVRDREGDDMFTTYTAVRGDALETLPDHLAPVLAPLVAKEPMALPAGIRPCFDMPPDELMVDGFALLEALYEANDLDRAPLDAFEAWAKDTLIAGHRVSPKRTKVAGDWCGFSLFVPGSRRALARYADRYPIYQQTQLDEVMDHLLKSAEARLEAQRQRLRERRQRGAQGGDGAVH